MLVEDELDLRELYSELLSREGYEVVAASCGEEALRILSQSKDRFDLLLTDVLLPNLGGVEVANRAMLSEPRLRVLYMSGYAVEAFPRARIILGERTHWIEKPFQTRDLVAKIREVLGS